MRRANIVYLPPRRPKTMAFLQHFSVHKTAVPTIYISDAPEGYAETGLEIVRMPALVDEATYGDLPFFRRSDHYAAQAFLNTIKFATGIGLREFMWIEDDCWVKGPLWDKDSWVEWEGRLELQVCSGFPCISGFMNAGWSWDVKLITFLHSFYQYAGVPATVEPMWTHDFDRAVTGPAIFPNGAFAIYNLEMLRECFVRPLANFLPHRHEAIFFDIRVGIWLAKFYGEHRFGTVLPTKHVYSGCGNMHINKVERRALTKVKNGVHNWYHEPA